MVIPLEYMMDFFVGHCVVILEDTFIHDVVEHMKVDMRFRKVGIDPWLPIWFWFEFVNIGFKGA